MIGTAAGTTTAIDTGDGNDIFQLSSDGVTTSGHLDGLLGPLTLIGGTGANTLSAVDQDSVAGNATTVTGTSITGLAPVPIAYTASGGFGGGILIRGSNHADSVAIHSTPAGATVDLRTLGGDDTVNISSDGTGVTGGLAAIGGDLVVDLGSGSNALALSDADETAPGANAAVQIGSDSITGLAGNAGGSTITYRATGGNLTGGLAITGSASVSVPEGYTVSDPAGPFSLGLGPGDDAVVLRSSAFATTVAAGAGNDTLTLGDATGSLEGFRAPMTLDGGTGANTLALTDSGDGSADIVTLTANQIGAAVGNSLLGPGGTVTYSNWSSVSGRRSPSRQKAAVM